MWTDPVVEEIHQIRQRIWEECGGDWTKYLDRLKSHRADYQHRLISPQDLRRERREAEKPAGR